MRQVARKSVGLTRAETWVMGRLTHQRDISEVSNDGRPHVTGGEQDRASYDEDSDEDMPSLEAADEDRFSPHSPHEDGFSSYSPHDDGFSPHSPPLSPLSPREHSPSYTPREQSPSYTPHEQPSPPGDQDRDETLPYPIRRFGTSQSRRKESRNTVR